MHWVYTVLFAKQVQVLNLLRSTTIDSIKEPPFNERYFHIPDFEFGWLQFCHRVAENPLNPDKAKEN